MAAQFDASQLLFFSSENTVCTFYNMISDMIPVSGPEFCVALVYVTFALFWLAVKLCRQNNTCE